MANDHTNMLTYLVKFEWNSYGSTLWPMRGYSEDPNSSSYQGNQHLDSIIYFADSSVSSSDDNFPVNGYIVGKTASIWSYNSCTAQDFEISPSYERLFTSPEHNKQVGFISKIENDQTSCKREKIDPIKDVVNIAVNNLGDTGTVTQ